MKLHTIIRAFGAILLAATLAANLHATDPIVTDSVEDNNANGSTDWSSKWHRIGTGGAMTSTSGGLVATSGSNFWLGNSPTSAGNRGIARYYTDATITTGTYTIEFDLGAMTDVVFTTNLEIALLADTDSNTQYDYSERFGIVGISSLPTFTDGTAAWKHVELTVVVTADTKTAGDQSVVGTTLGFMILSNVPVGYGYAFDNLTISHTAPVPEPGTTAAIAGLVTLAAALYIPRHRR
ncbi:hypothetical protein [Geminisphaera colitermitum]|uniref:hypothetical protein n=1 Tax=Geminisphaera colitermitum TaxID=1148786 RepID=UPI000158C629|nr:hypothetical protein [Geminisphaera colitermitum]